MAMRAPNKVLGIQKMLNKYFLLVPCLLLWLTQHHLGSSAKLFSFLETVRGKEKCSFESVILTSFMLLP